MSSRIFITGLGVVSAIGNNVEETLASVQSQRSGIGNISYLETVHKNILPIAEVKLSEDELIERAGIKNKYGITRTSLLGIIAASEAAENAQLHKHTELRTGLISSTSVGGMGKTEIHYKEFLNTALDGDFLQYIDSHDCGDSTERIADHLNIKDFISTISTACSSSANAIMFGARLIKHNIIDRAVVGGTDSLSKFTLNGFNTLMILDKDRCKPFDDKRNGLTLGEGAGYLVIESERAASITGNKILGELTGYGNANDAYHQTASSPDGNGAYLAMKKALEMSGLNTEAIGYINAHGTGTLNNDLSEGRAIEKLFGTSVPLISSTKSYTGHTLAACGGIEAVLSLLTFQNNFIIPNLNFSEQMKELSFSPVTAIMNDVTIENILSNSFGFGGNNSTLIFSRYRS